MNVRCQKLFRRVKNGDGFTLIEMLIVIIILGILAMVIIPQITVSTDDARVSTLKSNLTAVRSAIEVYYAQHNMTYPGVKKETDGTTATANATEAKAAFLAQMTLFSDANGKTAAAKDSTYKYGPYIKGGSLPDNPYSNNDVVCDLTVTNLPVTRAVSGTVGWQYLPVLGVFFANDAGSSGGTAHISY
ncbi:MAG TPA: prepilin-type N-terminal cleavage/methylation domain-containing protein [Syntrophales bacterium]|nr:prepilin-type N-terminal cleavage/methylation domain-containing protein [Syntrophales bacterium]